MSVTSSIPCIKIKTPSPSPSPSSSSFSSSSSFPFRFYSTKPHVFTIRNSQTDGPLRRPVAPSVREPSPPPSPLKPTPPSPSPSSTVAPPQKPAAVLVGDDRNVITLEFQRQKAKELKDYFKQKKLEDADQGPFFGFIGKNEIANGSRPVTPMSDKMYFLSCFGTASGKDNPRQLNGQSDPLLQSQGSWMSAFHIHSFYQGQVHKIAETGLLIMLLHRARWPGHPLL